MSQSLCFFYFLFSVGRIIQKDLNFDSSNASSCDNLIISNVFICVAFNLTKGALLALKASRIEIKLYELWSI